MARAKQEIACVSGDVRPGQLDAKGLEPHLEGRQAAAESRCEDGQSLLVAKGLLDL